MTWQPMQSAPDDGTWIEGQNEAGETARIQSRKIHPKVELKKWFAGEPESDGNWERNVCFYPVAWRPL